MEILVGRPTNIDSGSGTTVDRRFDLLRFKDVVVKTYNLHGSEDVNIHSLRAYQELTNRVARKVGSAREDLRMRVFSAGGVDHRFSWVINPIHHVGEGSDGVYSTSPLIQGVSLGELFTNKQAILTAIDPELVNFLRDEFARFRKLLDYEFSYQNLKLIALNVTLTNLDGEDHQLVVTNIREYINNRGNPLRLIPR